MRSVRGELVAADETIQTRRAVEEEEEVDSDAAV